MPIAIMTIDLTTLLRTIRPLPSQGAIPVTGLALDSRHVRPGDVFFACQGTQQDGRQFIAEALRKGAVAILAEGTGPDCVEENIFFVPNLKQQLSAIAAHFYHEPARSLQIIGITGTNGKTSCSHFIAAALQQLAMPCGIIGTLGNGFYGALEPSHLTTPDAIAVQKILADLGARGATHVAMEVSSHSLDQGRVNAVPFSIGIFTNLTRDHLDYHGSLEAYGAAKQKLFMGPLKHAIINVDDLFGQSIRATLPKPIAGISYSLGQKADVSIQKLQSDAAGFHAEVVTPWGQGTLHTRLLGQFNLSNTLAVLAALCLLDIPLAVALECISGLCPVDGRMQTWGGNTRPLVIVDYAHTPDALEKALQAIKAHCDGKLYCIFGCGGDRDRGKRALMAEIAERIADVVCVTDDNPRTEAPAQIVADVMQGFSRPEKVHVQHDRAKAIYDTIHAATAGDCILVAGKGAEMYQHIGNKKIPFSDAEKVKKYLSDLGE